MSGRPADFSLGDRGGLSLTNEIEELNDNFSILNEVDPVSRSAYIIDYLTRLINVLLDLIAHIDYFHEWPVAYNWYLFQKCLALAIFIHQLNSFHHHIAGFRAQEDLGACVTDDSEVTILIRVWIKDNVVADNLILCKSLDNLAVDLHYDRAFKNDKHATVFNVFF